MHAVLTWVVFGDKSSVPYPGLFTPVGRARGTHWTGGWVGLGGRLDALEKAVYLNCPAYSVVSTAAAHCI